MEKLGNIDVVDFERESREVAEHVKLVTIQALQKTFAVHESLGASGEEQIRNNQFGETALRVDIEAERAVLDYLKELHFPVKIISEEHGIVEIGDHPVYLGVLDGLDGSGLYKRERGRGRYGTMFGIFKTLNPSYGDYLASGVMEHATGRLFIAAKHGGAFVRQGEASTSVRASGKMSFDAGTHIYLNKNRELVRKTFSETLKGLTTQCANSTATHYVDVASGVMDVALEDTRKGNLEIAAAYGLLKEAGAVTVDMQGNEIEDKKYADFGQQEHIPLVTAATKELALDLLKYLQQQR